MSALDPKLENACIDTLRFLAVDAVEEVGTGHPGTPMGTAALGFVLWHDFMRFDPSCPNWLGRDRFILSAGHAAMLLYGLLHCASGKPSLDDIRRFRQWGSLAPGHPERDLVPGVEMTTGPLGQGFASSVGLALASKIMTARLDGGGAALADYRVFCLASDGDFQEGVSYEAAALAGHLKLGNLTCIHDANEVSIEGPLCLSSSEDVPARFRALGWETVEADGLSASDLRQALAVACEQVARPTLITMHTRIGYGSPKEGSSECHGAPLGPEAAAATRENLGWPTAPRFHVPEEVRGVWQRWNERMRAHRLEWERRYDEWRERQPENAWMWETQHRDDVGEDLFDQLLRAAEGPSTSGRALSGRILQCAAELHPGIVGGSADLSGSNKSRIEEGGFVEPDDASGRNIHFGIREHAMAAVSGGLALSGLFRPFCSTYLVFSDYMRPSIRLAALMNLPVTYLFTHDSFLLGQDGPTHQPIEQLWSLRLVPGLRVFRPADAMEVAAAWTSALTSRMAPHALVLARQELPNLERGEDFDEALLLRGGYTLVAPEGGTPSVIIVATGSEVALALDAARALAEKGERPKVVSLPCVELFQEQPRSYRLDVITPDVPVVTIEAGATRPWRGLLGEGVLAIGLDRFGASAPAPVLARELEFTVEDIEKRIADWLTLRRQ